MFGIEQTTCESLSYKRVISAGMKWVALEDPDHSQKSTLYNTVFRECMSGIDRTGREKTAAPGQRRRDKPLI